MAAPSGRRHRGDNSLLSPLFLIGAIMRLIELFEGKSAKKLVVKSPAPRNFVAKNSKTAGAGPHEPKGYNRKEKHKKPTDAD